MSCLKNIPDDWSTDHDTNSASSSFSDWSFLNSSDLELSIFVSCTHYDCLVVHSSSKRDRKMAINFKKIVEKHLQLDDGNPPRVCVYDENKELEEIRSPSQRMAEAVKRSTSIFMLMTEDFITDKSAEIHTDEALMLSIEDPTKRGCIVPLHTKSKTDRNFRYPFGLGTLKGLDVWKMLKNEKLEEVNPDNVTLSDLNEQFLNSLTKLFNQRLDQRLKREREEKAKLAARHHKEMEMDHKQRNDNEEDMMDLIRQMHSANVSAAAFSENISKNGLIIIENKGNLQVGHGNIQNIYNDVEVQDSSDEEIIVTDD